jgi:CheY-like chemotaxis protein
MFSVLIADDSYEDRELLKLEISNALSSEEVRIKFYEASSVRKAMEILKSNTIDMMTLDIEFDRLSEGIDALPEIFEAYPTLNIIVISGKLNKNEVTERLFRFTKDNVLKGKRWVRHFDVLDKKDDKREAVQRALSFAFRQKETAGHIRDLFKLAESYLEKEEKEKCIEVYRKIQNIAPGETESSENIKILSNTVAPEQVLKYMRAGDHIVASLLLGHYVERRLKAFTRKRVGRAFVALSDCLNELDRARRIKPFKRELFSRMLRIRNKAIHRPSAISEEDVQSVFKDMNLLEARF